MNKIWSLFSMNSNILKFLLSPVRFTKCLGVRLPLHPPRKKALIISTQNEAASVVWWLACWPLVPKFARSNLAEAVGFFGRKNTQRAFLQKGSKAFDPMS
jgi:hypothetical protein